MLVHQSQAGCIIGKGGLKIKELREVSQKCSYAINAIQAGLHRFYDCHVQLRAKASVPCSSDEFNRLRGLYAISSLLMLGQRAVYVWALERSKTTSVFVIFGYASSIGISFAFTSIFVSVWYSGFQSTFRRVSKILRRINLLTAEFSFENPSRDTQVKRNNDEYTRRTYGKCSYYKFYEKSKAKRGSITFLFDKKLTIRCWKSCGCWKLKNCQKVIKFINKKNWRK